MNKVILTKIVQDASLTQYHFVVYLVFNAQLNFVTLFLHGIPVFYSLLFYHCGYWIRYILNNTQFHVLNIG